MSELTVSEVREHLADAIDQARSEPVYLSRRGRRVAVLLDAALYEHLLEQLEDAEDAQAADQARAELAAGAEPIPWEHVKADLGIDV